MENPYHSLQTSNQVTKLVRFNKRSSGFFEEEKKDKIEFNLDLLKLAELFRSKKSMS